MQQVDAWPRPFPCLAPTPAWPVPSLGQVDVSGLLDGNQALIDSLDGQLQEALKKQQLTEKDCERRAARCDDLLVPMKPLASRLQIAARAESIGRVTGLVSGVNLFLGRVLSTAAPNLAVPFMLADIAILATSFAAVHWGRATWSQGYPRLEELVDRWNAEKAGLDQARSLDQRQGREVARLDGLVKHEQGQRTVLEVAAALTVPPPAEPSALVSQDDDAIVIGRIHIPRRVGA